MNMTSDAINNSDILTNALRLPLCPLYPLLITMKYDLPEQD